MQLKLIISLFCCSLVGNVLGIPSLFSYPPEFGDGGGEGSNNGHHILVTDRLPQSISPSLYRLEIRPILDEGVQGQRFTAPGKIWMTGNATTPTSSISFHTADMQIHQESITVTEGGSNDNIPILSQVPEISKEYHTINLNRALSLGATYTIYVEFTAKVNNENDVGLYVARYRDTSGQMKVLATTDFEAPDARRSKYEPQLKAEWEIEIIRQPHYHSLSNMALSRTEPSVPGLDGWVKDVYIRTVPMSSYLVCFVVSDFASEAANPSLYRLPLRVWGPPPLINRGNAKFSPDFSAKIISFFESYYNIPYSFPKMDEISIPDYSSGAMENWGLNTYRDTRLLYEEGISTAQDMFSMTNTISHELVHQWWGNIITCEWWNDLWVQEGAATYYAPVAVAAVMPELMPMETLITSTVQRSLAFDASPATHPIHNMGVDPAGSVLFDTLTYHKGCSLIRMMVAFLSEPVYNSAMTKFINKFAFGNVHQDDLFAALDEEVSGSPGTLPAGVTVTNIMSGWTNQSGFPIVTVSWNEVTGAATFTQGRFFEKKEDGDAGDTTRWHIPLAIQRNTDTDVNTSPQLWILQNQTSITSTISAQWFVVNPQTAGYFRVSYNSVLWDRIINQLLLNHTVFDVQTRSALLDDALSEAYAGYLDLAKAIAMTKYLTAERELFPWVTFVTQMALPYRMFGRASAFPLFKKYIIDLMAPTVAQMSFEPQPTDANPMSLLRTRLVEWNCNLGNDDCINYAKNKFALWMNNPGNTSLVFPDLQPTVYCTAVAHGGDTEWNFLWSQYQIADRDVMQQNLLRALSCAKSSFRLNTLIEMAIVQNSGILNKHRTLTIQAVAGSSIGVDLVFNFIRNNYDTIVRRWGTGMITSVISTLANNMNQSIDKDDLLKFIASKPELGSVSLNNLDMNIRWMNNHFAEFVRLIQPSP